MAQKVLPGAITEHRARNMCEYPWMLSHTQDISTQTYQHINAKESYYLNHWNHEFIYNLRLWPRFSDIL